MQAHRFFAASTLCLLCSAAFALAQNTRNTKSPPAGQSGTPVEIPLATASRIGRAKKLLVARKKRASTRRFC
jgi:hypothetical protein